MKRITSLAIVALCIVMTALATADRPAPVPYPVGGHPAAAGSDLAPGKQFSLWNTLRGGLLLRMHVMQTSLDRLNTLHRDDVERINAVLHDLSGVRAQLLGAGEVSTLTTKDVANKFGNAVSRMEARTDELAKEIYLDFWRSALTWPFTELSELDTHFD